MEEDLICQYCGKLCKNDNSLRNHERLCKENPDRQQSSWIKFNKERGAWNKGLTKDTDERLKKAGETYRSNLKSGITKQYDHRSVWNDDRRRAKSEEKIRYFSEHPERHPNAICAGNRGKMNFPERMTYDWLIDHGVEVIHNYHFVTKRFNRYVDFYLPEFKIFIEVDGERWHKDKIRDNLKDEDALEHGIITIRIPAGPRVIEHLEEHVAYRIE